MRPSWQPDPTGRHDYRWWTGVDWSDQVGDRGSVSIDPRPVVPPTTGAATETDIRRRRLLVAVVATALVAAVVAVVLVRRGPDDPTVRELQSPGTGPVERRITLRAGEVIRFRIEPSLGLDPHVVVTTEESTAEALAALIAEGGEPADALADRLFPDAAVALDLAAPVAALAGQVVLMEVDAVGTDRPEAGWFFARASGEYRLVVVDAPPVRPGRFRTVVERADQRYPVDTALGAAVVAGPFFVEPTFFESAAPYPG